MLTDPLLKTKVIVPQARPSSITRPKLVKKLNAGLNGRFTLVSAPPGSGKTTLIRQWVQDLNHTYRLGWLSLDDHDDDPAVFITYLVAAIKTADVAIHSTEEALQFSPRPPLKTLIAYLINDLASAKAPFVLVLDDLHFLTNSDIQQSLEQLLRNLPEHIHLVLITRQDPAFSLARWRAKGDLTEIRTADLRFSDDESGHLLQQMGLSLSDQQIADLNGRAEGWAAGLQLAALSLNNQSEFTQFINAFSGRQAHIFDYLADEIFNAQPPEVQTFLLATGLLDRFCADLCTAVLPETAEPISESNQGLLERLDKANLFLVALDHERQWFRYHHLFADFLRNRLQRHGTLDAETIYRQAAEWSGSNGFLEEGIQYAVAANSFEQAADLLIQANPDYFRRGALGTILKWFKLLPGEIIQNRPNLCVQYSWALTLSKQTQSVERYLQAAEQWLERPENADIQPGFVGSIKGNIANIRATIAYKDYNTAEVIVQSEQAIAQLPKGLIDQRSIVALNLGRNYVDRGQFETAERALFEALAESQTGDYPFIQLRIFSTLAWLYQLKGQLFQATNFYKQALDLVERYERQGKRLLADPAYAGLSQIAYEWNNLTEAESYLERAVRQEEMSGNAADWQTQLALMQLRLAQRDWEGATSALETAEQLIAVEQNMENRPILLAWQAIYHHQTNDSTTAVRQARLAYDKLSQLSHPSPDLNLFIKTTLAWMLVLNKETTVEGQSLLKAARQTAEAFNRASAIILIDALCSLAYWKLNRPDSAVKMLELALETAELGGYLRLFLDLGPTLVPILTACSPSTYRDRLLAEFSNNGQLDLKAVGRPSYAANPPVVEPLTSRELETLNHLATTMTIPEIAQELAVAVSTVRTYCKRIYAKLNVHSRAEAVYKAQAIRLLEQESK